MQQVTDNTVTQAVDVTQLLRAWQEGDDQAANMFIPEVYGDLRRMAASRLRREASNVLFATTDLVNEAMLRLFAAQARNDFRDAVPDNNDPANSNERKPFLSRSHFLAVSALYMRSVLVDRARAAKAREEPDRLLTMTMAFAQPVNNDVGPEQLLALDRALQQLKAEDLRASRVVELAIFASMPREEIALVLDISIPTVDRDLRFARAYLNDALL